MIFTEFLSTVKHNKAGKGNVTNICVVGSEGGSERPEILKVTWNDFLGLKTSFYFAQQRKMDKETLDTLKDVVFHFNR